MQVYREVKFAVNFFLALAAVSLESLVFAGLLIKIIYIERLDALHFCVSP